VKYWQGKSGDKGLKKRNKRYQMRKKTIKIVQTSERSPQAGESQIKSDKKLRDPMHKRTKRSENGSDTTMRIIKGIIIVQAIKGYFSKKGIEENVC